ncbi:hypothetical protein ANOM_002220 [Aspergillus nomiae NRRL 13137]|uniref:Uncharacterized protein n=1 Tax=Aspergillus nomiae NRRL (strain ATCC 15546 / NRRL 13137 / CBS 260.88 / M93) TaxID=1509407 RepID=A0A0L1JB93_ASPN3|nr:uncharacterized protein ANOM_002220 [Aspergillus nomiae NRRL 13137]KNG88970.1 hypothetical protein ANOM_002220 [Aspergillus nomiae NRRL 13137]
MALTAEHILDHRPADHDNLAVGRDQIGFCPNGDADGSIPLNSTVSEPVTTEDSDPKGPYAVPTLIVTGLFQGFSAFYAYTRYLSSGHTAFAIGMIGYSMTAAIGLWCVLFASSNGKISRKTGADKRTAGFPFKNTEAAKKHAWKKSS